MKKLMQSVWVLTHDSPVTRAFYRAKYATWCQAVQTRRESA
jgi:hypothetical protein